MSRRLALIGLALALVAAPILAQGIHQERFSNGIEFWSGSNYSSLSVRISGGGDVYDQSFGPDESAMVSIADLPDGNYTFEATLSPTTSLVRGEDVEVRMIPQRTWGFFTVRDGVLVQGLDEGTGGAVETPTAPGVPTKDQVFLDDLIVNGSICAGLDCNNGESFGFDTLRLKENNLRIKFQDTSNSASFPTNDWQITANDSSNGGANKFSIDDIDGGRTPFTIEASAPSNSLFVDDGGRLGFGTSTPTVELHVVDGNTPTLRLEQDGSNGFTPQTWDVAGNEANFFVRDATNGSKLPVKIKPGADTSSIFIAADGSVGMGGTESPTGVLHLFDGSSSTNLDFDLENTSAFQWRFRVNTTGQLNFVDRDNGSTPFRIGDDADNTLMQVGVTAANRVDITGQLWVNNMQMTVPDYVFDADYELLSIDEQAAYMWKNKHLPSVGGAIVEANGMQSVNLTKRADGVLEELEKAHIYIEQLHNRINELEGLKAEVEELKQLLLLSASE